MRSRLSGLRLSPTREAEIVDELSQHLDDRYRESLSAGHSSEDAIRLSLAGFQGDGLLAQHMSRLRQANAPPIMTPAAPTAGAFTDLWHDLRCAARVPWRQPGFAIATVFTLALGIGATTAIFSVVYGVLLKPLPFHDPQRLVSLLHRGPGANLETMNQGPATFLTYLDNQRAFAAIGAWDSTQVSVTGRGEPEQVRALTVSDTTLPLLGVPPHRGRLFTAADTVPGGPLQAMLTYGYWQRRFGGEDSAVGEQLQVDGQACVIIGVLPPTFRFLRTDPAMVLPMRIDRATAFGGINFDRQAIGRLRPGVTIDQAHADIARMIPLLPPVYNVLKLEPKIRPLAEEVIGDVRRILWVLLAAVGAVLLIACGNVANLFLIRAEGRHQELAIRAALGAGTGRLARVLLAESVLLALAGGAAGLLFAEVAIGVLRRMAPAELPRIDDIGIDAPVLLFALAISVLSGVVFGLVAVMGSGRPRAGALKDGGRSNTDGPVRHRTRNVLVVSQVALAFTLLVASGLMVRTFVAMRDVHPGFAAPESVMTFRVAIPPPVISDRELVARAHQRITERLSSIPGVASVGLSSSITMDGEDNTNPLFVEDAPVADGALPPLRRYKSVGPGYFETMGIPVVAGRSTTWAEIYERRPVVVVSEAIAREYWTEPRRAVGKRVRGQPSGAWYEIVGVVGAEHDDGLNRPATAIVYWPMLSDAYRSRTMAYAVRSSRVGGVGFLPELQRAVWSVNPNLPLAAVQTLDEIQANSMVQTSFSMVMLAIAAAVAVVLGVVGIYGVVAYIAAQRTREIGIRLALGAQVSDVRRLFLRHGLWLTGAGLGIGIAAALALSRVMSALLFGVSSADPMTFAAVAATLGAVALLATYLPARSAARVDPIAALRTDA